MTPDKENPRQSRRRAGSNDIIVATPPWLLATVVRKLDELLISVTPCMLLRRLVVHGQTVSVVAFVARTMRRGLTLEGQGATALIVTHHELGYL